MLLKICEKLFEIQSDIPSNISPAVSSDPIHSHIEHAKESEKDHK